MNRYEDQDQVMWELESWNPSLNLKENVKVQLDQRATIVCTYARMLHVTQICNIKYDTSWFCNIEYDTLWFLEKCVSVKPYFFM